MKNKLQIIILAAISLSMCCPVSAQSKKAWQDTPTPAEIALHDAPYNLLQQEIQNKLCDKDWEIDAKNKEGDYEAPFLILKDHPNEDVILRGATVHYFLPLSRGIECKVHLNPSSPLFKINNDSALAQSQIVQDQMTAGYNLFAKASKNNYKYTAADSAEMDKMKIASDNANKEMAFLSNERMFATIRMELNSNWSEVEKGRVYYLDGGTNFDAGRKLPSVQGANYSVLFSKKPWKLDPNTFYEAVVYIGNWPPQTDLKKRTSFHFVHQDKIPWTDKQHSGKPFLENMKIIIQGENYDRVMKVIHSIDWTKLDALVKGQISS